MLPANHYRKESHTTQPHNMMTFPKLPEVNSNLDLNVLTKLFKVIEPETIDTKTNRIIVTARNKPVFLPTLLNPELAYFAGYLFGDGYLCVDKKRLGFSDEYETQMKRINECAIRLFNSSGRLFSRLSLHSLKPSYNLEISRKAINWYLHNILSMPRGEKNELEIPENIRTNLELLRWFLRGLFDADGTLPKNPEKAVQLFIDFSSKSKKLILAVRDALKQFRIETLEPYARISKSPTTNRICITWELRIRRKGQILLFLEEIGFTHPNKRLRQEKILYGSVAQPG